MKPAELTGSSFTQYPPIARQFALEHLELLRRLPLAVCPSFLQQIRDLDTRFPAEREELRWQCDSLQRLPAEKFTALTTFLSRITLPESLQRANWVQHPADFINDLTAHLWSSGQLDSFRAGSHAFFAAIPLRENTADRLVVVLLGREATTPTRSVLRKLSQRGVVLSALSQETAFRDLHALVAQHAAASPEPYANWYVDGGEPSVSLSQGIPNIITVSYPGLAPLRQRVLQRMDVTLNEGSGGAEQMRTRLTGTSAREVDAAAITSDPVLQRFYTELFTESSGPQIFSTSFVQWTGRELAKRAQPRTLVLRYAPRQKHTDLNEMFGHAEASSADAEGAFRDAEMGAFYTWLEMSRVTAPGKLTFLAWVEGRPLGVLLSANAPAGAVCSTPMTLQQAMQSFG